MAMRHYLAHNSPDGVAPAERISGVGIGYRTVGENIYMDDNADSADVPQRAMKGWLKSPEHLANIVSEQVHRDRRRNRSFRRRRHLRYARFRALTGAAMDFAELAALASGHAEARAIQTALKLGIFDMLERSPLDDAALAAAISANRRATALIANAMVALELLDKRAERYSLTEASRRYLLRSSPEYLGGLILFDEAFFQTWTHLEQTIRTGLPARPTDMFQSRPEETERFIRAMDSLTRARGDAAYVADRIDLSKVSKLADHRRRAGDVHRRDASPMASSARRDLRSCLLRSKLRGKFSPSASPRRWRASKWFASIICMTRSRAHAEPCSCRI